MQSRTRRWLQVNRGSCLLMLIFSVLPLLAATAFASATWLMESAMRTWTPASWFFVFVGFAFTIAVGLTPTTLVAIWTGYILGWWALPGVVVSYLLATVICATLVRRVDRGRFYQSLVTYPKVRRLVENLHAHQFWIIVLSKLSPILPFAVTNLVLLVNGIRLPLLLLSSAIGMLPRTVACIWIGGSLQEFRSSETTSFSATPWLGSVLIILTLAGLGFILRRAWPKPDASVAPR